MSEITTRNQIKNAVPCPCELQQGDGKEGSLSDHLKELLERIDEPFKYSDPYFACHISERIL